MKFSTKNKKKYLKKKNKGATFKHLKESSLNENLKNLFLREKIPIEMRLNALKLFQTLFEKRNICLFIIYYNPLS